VAPFFSRKTPLFLWVYKNNRYFCKRMGEEMLLEQQILTEGALQFLLENKTKRYTRLAS